MSKEAAIIANKEKLSDFSVDSNGITGKCNISGTSYHYVGLESQLTEGQQYWYNSCKITIPPSFHLLRYELKNNVVIIDYAKTFKSRIGEIESNGNKNLLFAFNIDPKPLAIECYESGNLLEYDYKRGEIDILNSKDVEAEGCGVTCRESIFYSNNSKLLVFANLAKEPTESDTKGDIVNFFIPCLGKKGEERTEANIIYRRIDSEDILKKWIILSKSGSGIACGYEDGKNTEEHLSDGLKILYYPSDVGLKLDPACYCKPVE